jgi:hypothetical protein
MAPETWGRRTVSVVDNHVYRLILDCNFEHVYHSHYHSLNILTGVFEYRTALRMFIIAVPQNLALRSQHSAYSFFSIQLSVDHKPQSWMFVKSFPKIPYAVAFQSLINCRSSKPSRMLSAF